MRILIVRIKIQDYTTDVINGINGINLPTNTHAADVPAILPSIFYTGEDEQKNPTLECISIGDKEVSPIVVNIAGDNGQYEAAIVNLEIKANLVGGRPDDRGR